MQELSSSNETFYTVLLIANKLPQAVTVIPIALNNNNNNNDGGTNSVADLFSNQAILNSVPPTPTKVNEPTVRRV